MQVTGRINGRPQKPVSWRFLLEETITSPDQKKDYAWRGVLGKSLEIYFRAAKRNKRTRVLTVCQAPSL